MDGNSLSIVRKTTHESAASIRRDGDCLIYACICRGVCDGVSRKSTSQLIFGTFDQQHHGRFGQLNAHRKKLLRIWGHEKEMKAKEFLLLIPTRRVA